MLFYHRQGSVPPKRYTVLRGGPDGIYHEELLSTEGFTGASSTLYRLHPPTRITRVEELAVPEQLFGDKYSGGTFRHDGRHAWLRIVPEKIVSWDFRKIPTG